MTEFPHGYTYTIPARRNIPGETRVPIVDTATPVPANGLGRSTAPEKRQKRRIAALQDKLQRTNVVVAELLEEHVKLSLVLRATNSI
jgi:hypothetical protein